MKKRIFIITLALIFGFGIIFAIAGNMGKGKGNNNWGVVEVPTNVTVNLTACDEVEVCWDIDDEEPFHPYPADKWSVVLKTVLYLDWNGTFCDICDCECPEEVELEIDFGTNDADEVTGLTFNDETLCLEIDVDLIEDALDIYLDAVTADCAEGCTYEGPALYGYTTDTWDTKVKGLDAPGDRDGKKGGKRQNNEFTDDVEVEGLDDCFNPAP